MAVTINSILGGPAQDVISNAEAASAYFTFRQDAGPWTNASSDKKAYLLQHATALLLSTVPIGGVPMFKLGLTDEGELLTINESPPFFLGFDQRLAVPKARYATGENHKTYAGSNASGSATTVVDSGIANVYPDDTWNMGTILFTSRTPVVLREITDYTGSTGTFTFATLSPAPSVDEEYTAIYPLPLDIYWAVWEQALFIAGGRFDFRANMIAQGAQIFSEGGVSENLISTGAGGYISRIALDLIKPYRAKARFQA